MTRLFLVILTTFLINNNFAYADHHKDDSMPALSFSTTVIYVKDNANTVLDFYQQAFGFTLKYYDENMDFGELETGSTSIMVSSYQAGKIMMGDAFPLKDDGQKNDDGSSNKIELAFLTDDVASAYQKAIGAGATSAKEPVTHPWGQTAAYVYGIEGTLIGILSPLPTQN